MTTLVPAMGASATPVISLADLDPTLYRLLKATLRHERLVAERDQEIAAIQNHRGPSIERAAGEMVLFESQIEACYLANRESLEQGKKSVQRANGLMGMRAPSNPALIPYNDKWTWETIAEKVRAIWKKKYFHAPKPPGLDKVKLKKSLDEKQLKECGLRIDTTENFYLELNRLAIPDVLDEEARERAA